MKKALIALLFIFLCACNAREENPSFIETEAPAAAWDTQVVFDRENSLLKNISSIEYTTEGTYYSPGGGSRCIRQKAIALEGNSMYFELFLGDIKIDGRERGVDTSGALPAALWLDDTIALLYGTEFFDCNTMSKAPIDFSYMLGNVTEPDAKKAMLTYSISPDKTEIAYLSSLEYSIKLYKYTISSQEWIFLYEVPYDYEDTSDEIYNVYWTADNKIYFTTHYERIFCYDPVANQATLFKQGVLLNGMSLDGRYLAVHSRQFSEAFTDIGPTDIVDISTEATVFQLNGLDFCFDSQDILYYLQDGYLIVVDLDDTTYADAIHLQDDVHKFVFKMMVWNSKVFLVLWSND